MDVPPVDAFLADFPDGIRNQAHRLREVVRRAVPDAVEAVRPGWRLIGYSVPAGRRLRYFGYVAPEPEHVHLGFEHGVLIDDPEQLLEGAHLGLRQVRFLTFRPGDVIAGERLAPLVRQGARVASLDRSSRLAIALDRA